MRHFILLLCLGISVTTMKAQQTYSLEFNPEKYTTETFTFEDKTYTVRAFEHIIYVANPIDTTYQQMNIYIPEDYFRGEQIRGFTRETAPVFFPNGVGGYMPSAPMSLNNQGRRNIFGQPRNGAQMPQPPQQPPGANMKQGSAIHYALAKGYIVASAGARGRSLQNSEGLYTGKAPAGIVDLKAAVCYLRYNADRIPGDKDKIISNGTSAGGAMSTLLGATGNDPDYKPYLQEIGAADMPDDIYAVSAYCPITNLNHADCAYEWQFNGIDTYQSRMFDMIEGIQSSGPTTRELTPLQIKTSNQLKALFPAYLNSLELKDDQGSLLTVNESGEGNFKEFVIGYVLSAAQKALNNGSDLTNIPWLTVENKKAVKLDFEPYVRQMQRMKTPPAFDAFDMDAPENHLFGTATLPAQHFTAYSYDHSPDKSTLAKTEIINMMNPMYYIGKKSSKTSRFWHIRYGTIDNNTSLAIEVILATWLKNKGFEVDFELAWDRPHMGDYDLDELFEWMDKAVKR